LAVVRGFNDIVLGKLVLEGSRAVLARKVHEQHIYYSTDSFTLGDVGLQRLMQWRPRLDLIRYVLDGNTYEIEFNRFLVIATRIPPSPKNPEPQWAVPRSLWRFVPAPHATCPRDLRRGTREQLGLF